MGRERLSVIPRPNYPENALGVYVHVPFCHSKCPYCDFYSRASRSAPQDYDAIVLRELALHTIPDNAVLHSLYIGGGTPSMLSLATIERLLQGVAGRIPTMENPEITLECNPDDCSATYIRDLKSVGVNRVSLGVQALDMATLTFLGRRHTLQQSLQAIETIAHAGISSFSVDVIFGVPGQSDEALLTTLEQIVSFGTPHISAYHLTVEGKTKFAHMLRQGRFNEVDESISERQFNLVHQCLTTAGYCHYEVSNFALVGHLAQHNSAYWLGVPYIGLGPSAHSFDGNSRSWNIGNYERYHAALADGQRPSECERLTPDEAFEEWVLTRLRTVWGIDLEEGTRQFGSERIRVLRTKAEPLLALGHLQLQGGCLAIPQEHFILSDGIILSML